MLHYYEVSNSVPLNPKLLKLTATLKLPYTQKNETYTKYMLLRKY